MSIHEQAVAAVLSQIALAYIAVRSILKFTTNSSAVRKKRQTPSLRVSNLRSVLSSLVDLGPSNGSDGEKLLIVCSVVEAKSSVDGNWKNLRPNVLVSHESDKRDVVLQRTQMVSATS